MEYIVIQKTDIKKLQKEVQNKINQGFQPQGGLATNPSDYWGGESYTLYNGDNHQRDHEYYTLYSQAMVRIINDSNVHNVSLKIN